MDPDCSTCCHLIDAKNSLLEIARFIDYSCMNQSKKRDFGLDKSYIMKEVAAIQQMEKYHQYWHSTGSSLNDSETVLDSSLLTNKPKRFKKAE